MESAQEQNVVSAKEDILFFSNSKKEDRELWIASNWATLVGRIGQIRRGEHAPDFLIGSQGVEVSEVLVPGRRRHDEFRNVLSNLSSEKKPKPQNSSSLEEIERFGADWVFDGITKKVRLYGKSCVSWILVLYVNLAFSGRVNLEIVKRRLQECDYLFRRIDAILANRKRAITLFP